MGPPGWQDKTVQPYVQGKEKLRSQDLTRKVLTRHFKFVNTSCVNFIYNCEPYSIANTGVCSEAPPRGVDRSDSSDHLQPHVVKSASHD